MVPLRKKESLIFVTTWGASLKSAVVLQALRQRNERQKTQREQREAAQGQRERRAVERAAEQLKIEKRRSERQHRAAEN